MTDDLLQGPIWYLPFHSSLTITLKRELRRRSNMALITHQTTWCNNGDNYSLNVENASQCPLSTLCKTQSYRKVDIWSKCFVKYLSTNTRTILWPYEPTAKNCTYWSTFFGESRQRNQTLDDTKESTGSIHLVQVRKLHAHQITW
jgi:hypothetical protein